MAQPTASIAVPLSLLLPTHPRFSMLELAGHQHSMKQAVVLLAPYSRWARDLMLFTSMLPS
eukprot:10049689-Ditylum_brightwellii.AAC.1